MMQRFFRAIPGLLIAIVISVTSASARADEAPLTVTNFKFGLVCGTPDNRRVCFQTNLIQVSNESRCVFNKEVIWCTWYGFSFDYDATADVKINCVSSTDAVTALGNPNELLKPEQKFNFELELKRGKHHFFIAQYISGENSDVAPKRAGETCSLAGMELFSAEYQFQFTDETDPVESVPDVSMKK